jgi:hypothetical protein
VGRGPRRGEASEIRANRRRSCPRPEQPRPPTGASDRSLQLGSVRYPARPVRPRPTPAESGAPLEIHHPRLARRPLHRPGGLGRSPPDARRPRRPRGPLGGPRSRRLGIEHSPSGSSNERSERLNRTEQDRSPTSWPMPAFPRSTRPHCLSPGPVHPPPTTRSLTSRPPPALRISVMLNTQIA